MNAAASAHAAALWAGLCLIVLVVLSVLVTRQRRKHSVLLGDGGVPELQRAIRAFGNAAEYVPTALAGLSILAIAGAPPLLIHPIGMLLFAGRVLHAAGLSLYAGVSWPRNVGVLFTWVAYIAAAAALIFYAIP
jgi:uncharacterized membrane protein YecN with MAPEG domain